MAIVRISASEESVKMDLDDDDGFVHLLQMMLDEQQGDEFEDELIACVGLVCYGLEEAWHLSILRRSSQRLYLTHSNLLPDPRTDTPYCQSQPSTLHSISAYIFLHF